MPQFVRVRVINFLDRVQRQNIGGRDGMHGRQVRETFDQPVPLRVRSRRADHQDQRRRKGIRSRPHCIAQARDVRMLAAHQRYINATPIPCEQTVRIEQLLKHLVVSGESDLVIQSELPAPKIQSRFERFRGKCSADGDRAIVERHSIPL